MSNSIYPGNLIEFREKYGDIKTVGNWLPRDQMRRPWDGGTFAIKDLLQAKRYTWDSVRQTWEKSFPESGFNLDVVRAEVWAGTADGVDVCILDDAETEVASYKRDFGIWKCRFDYLGIPSPEGQMEVIK